MATKEEHIQTALDTLAEICNMSKEELDKWPNLYEKRGAAEEILRHYRETEITKDIRITVNGSIPVRPMTRSEIKES